MSLPGAVRTGPLALAARDFEQGASTARLCRDVGFAVEASTAAAALLEVAEIGPPQIRARARLAAVDTLTALSALTSARR